MNNWAKEAEKQIKTLEKYSKAQEEENQRNQQRIEELEGRVLEYEKEASIRAVIDAESLGGIEQQEGKA